PGKAGGRGSAKRPPTPRLRSFSRTTQPRSAVARVGGRHLVGVALAGGVGGVARGELPRREVGVRGRDALLEAVDVEAPRRRRVGLSAWVHRGPPFGKRKIPPCQGAGQCRLIDESSIRTRCEMKRI